MIEKVTLTFEETKIMEAVQSSLDGMTAYMGTHYELSLLSLADPDHAVVKIVNGFHTGRAVGAPMTRQERAVLENILSGKICGDHQVFFSKNKLGEPLKSLLNVIRGEEGRVIGLLQMNLYLGTPFIHVISEMLPRDHTLFQTEGRPESSAETIELELKNAREAVYGSEQILPSMRKKEVIRILYRRRVFEIKNSVEQVAGALDISVNTVYFHLRNIAKQEGGIA